MFGKTINQTKEKFTRSDLQLRVEAVLGHVLGDLGVPIEALDAAHGRRAVRSLLRVAARVAQRLGCDGPTFMQLASHCFAAEVPLDPRGRA